MKPLVSVVVPCYNCESTIKDTVESIVNQTYDNIEIILVDDCSSDGKTLNTLFLIKDKYKSSNIKVISLKANHGQSRTRNEGMDASCGKYIAFIDSDDLWIKNKISKQVELLEHHNEYYFIGTNQFLLSDYDYNSKNTDGNIFEKTLRELLKKNCFGMSSIMIRNDGRFRFDETIRYSSDFHFLCDILSNNFKSAYLNEKLVIYNNCGENRISSKHKKDQHKSCVALLKKLRSNRIIGFVSYCFFRLLYFAKYLRNLLIR